MASTQAIQCGMSFLGDGTTTAFISNLGTDPFLIFDTGAAQAVSLSHWNSVLNVAGTVWPTGVQSNSSGVSATVSTSTLTFNFLTAPLAGTIASVNFFFLYS